MKGTAAFKKHNNEAQKVQTKKKIKLYKIHSSLIVIVVNTEIKKKLKKKLLQKNTNVHLRHSLSYWKPKSPGKKIGILSSRTYCRNFCEIWENCFRGVGKIECKQVNGISRLQIGDSRK